MSGIIAAPAQIKVVLKDDNRGLGAKSGGNYNNDLCTGLDAFQGILGRLNGKGDEQVKRQQIPNVDLNRPIRDNSRWDAVHFVSGGFLVGDRQGVPVEKSATEELPSSGQPIPNIGDSIQQRSKELELHKPAGPTDPHNTSEPPISKEHRHKRNFAAVDDSGQVADGTNTYLIPSDQGVSEQTSPLDSDKPRRRLGKAERKSNLRKKIKLEQALSTKKPDPLASHEMHYQKMSLPLLPEVPAQKSSILSSSQSMGGRHAVRKQYIRHKKMAMMDQKALNEVRHAAYQSCR